MALALHHLDEGQVLQICHLLTGHDLARLQRCSKTGVFARVALSGQLWATVFERSFGPGIGSEPRAPPGTTSTSSWSQAYGEWHRTAQDLGLPAGSARRAGPRWIGIWRQIHGWCREHLPQVVQTLRPPVDPEIEQQLEAEGFGPLSLEVAGLWRVFDGQSAPVESALAEELGMPALREGVNWSAGMFGGYCAYDHEVATILLPLLPALRLTQFLHQRLPNLKEQHPTKLAFACSFNFNKIHFVDPRDGSVFAFTRRPSPLLERAVPESSGSPNDGLLRWMEEFAGRLSSGTYSVMPLRNEDPHHNLGLCLFSVSGPEVTRCVTRGVEVTASCVYMPEHPQGWTYSITFQLVGTKAERGFDTCQLHQRHWLIRGDNDSEPEQVNGEGVIGYFPILADGGWLLNRESDPHGQYSLDAGLVPGPFRYQSCSGRRRSMRGSFGGEITFVPGTIRKPQGEPFRVRMEPFNLHVPSFIY